MYGVRKCSDFILLHVAIEFSQHHLIEETVFSPLYVLVSFIIGAWVYFWVFYAFPVIHISVFVPVLCCFDDCSFVVQSEVGEPDFSSSVLSQICFGYSRGDMLLIYGMLFDLIASSLLNVLYFNVFLR